MKYILVLILIFVSTGARADFFTGLFLGSALSGPSQTVVVNKDEFTLQVEQIESQIPRINQPTPEQSSSFLIEETLKDKYLNYFSNGGYKVVYEKGKIVFDLTTNYQLYLQRQEQYQVQRKLAEENWQEIKPYFKIIGIIFLVIVGLTAITRSIIQMNQLGILPFFIKIITNQISKIKQNK